MSTISTTSTILGSLFSTLTTSTYGWTPGEVQEADSLINSSTLLVAELLDMQNEGWVLIAAPSGLTATNVDNIGHGSIVISALFGGPDYEAGGNYHGPPNYGATFDVAQYFVGALSYEVGHAEDPQFNTIDYSGTDLALGANVALDLFSEGKSFVNNVTTAEQASISNTTSLIAVLIPPSQVAKDLSAGNSSQAILDAASTVGLQGENYLLDYYWANDVTSFLSSITMTAPPVVVVTKICKAMPAFDRKAGKILQAPNL